MSEIFDYVSICWFHLRLLFSPVLRPKHVWYIMSLGQNRSKKTYSKNIITQETELSKLYPGERSDVPSIGVVCKELDTKLELTSAETSPIENQKKLKRERQIRFAHLFCFKFSNDVLPFIRGM